MIPVNRSAARWTPGTCTSSAKSSRKEACATRRGAHVDRAVPMDDPPPVTRRPAESVTPRRGPGIVEPCAPRRSSSPPTVVSGVATIVLAVLIGTDGERESVELRLGVLITRRRLRQHRGLARLRRKTETHPGTAFVTAHATDATANDLSAWSPSLRVRFPCDLGFDRTGRAGRRTVTSTGHRSPSGRRCSASTSSASAPSRTDRRPPRAQDIGARSGPPGRRPPAQDEYAMRRTIRRIESALGPRR